LPTASDAGATAGSIVAAIGSVVIAGYVSDRDDLGIHTAGLDQSC
jgi:hypothetical protein